MNKEQQKPINFKKTWQRESGTQPGLLLDVMNMQGVKLLKPGVRAQTGSKVA